MQKYTKYTMAVLIAAMAFSFPALADGLHSSGEVDSTEKMNDSDGVIKNEKNFPSQPDNTGKTVYYFGGNGFYGLHRGGSPEFGESFDSSTWLLEDTDAMWNGNYLYTQFGNTGGDANDMNSAQYNKDTAPNYYQSILTFGEGLYAVNKNKWFTPAELEAVGQATVTSTLGYRTYEHANHKTGSGGSSDQENTNEYYISAATADDISNYILGVYNNSGTQLVAPGKFSADYVKIFYDAKPSDISWDTYYLSRKDATVGAQAAADVTLASKVRSYLDNGAGINENTINIKASDVYSVINAHMYAPSVNEWTDNPAVYKQIQRNVSSEYAVRSGKADYHDGTGYPATQVNAFTKE